MERFALLIGVGDYPACGLAPLPAAARDIRALGTVLGHPEMGAFHVTLLEDPGRMEMEEAIESLFSGRDGDDLALFYFSGHGLKDDTGRLYLASRETRKTPNGELVRASAVAADNIRDNMARSRARRQVVILDSCHSGAFPAEWAAKDDGSIDIPGQLLPHTTPPIANTAATNTAPDGQGQAILTASTAGRYAFEKEDQALSLYTRFLIRGIETGEADENDNGFITAREWHEYARQKAEAEQPAMRPGLFLGGGGGAIRVAGVPVGDPKERYAREVERSLDRRGEIAIAARPRLDDWRSRLGLDPATYAAIEAEASAARRQKFDGKCREYAETVRAILKAGKSPADETEKTHLGDCRRRLGLTEEDAGKLQAAVEKELAAERERHDRNLQGYEAFFRATVQREGARFSDHTRGDLARLQETLGLSSKEVEAIESKVRREGEEKPPKEPREKK
uniref:Caspase domain-containing protein n=1 Tax=Candidatus Kentrum sp. FM TaxID=2126340 RepID=A0A450W394_9GAMM|nr:MAG: Caspase domain-containing protein [Candidatus Kentron sp. FM]VFJ58564.1 MAG: Caspase domain-containing protein [Candidatus Kentron sp. FM]VFK11558.1 MAG: Caspase domain-containing protein [Candidatus Kentron sp. FM]